MAVGLLPLTAVLLTDWSQYIVPVKNSTPCRAAACRQNSLTTCYFISGPLAQSVEGQTINGRWCRASSLLSSVTWCICNVTQQGAARTAGQLCYVPLGRHLVVIVVVVIVRLKCYCSGMCTKITSSWSCQQ